MATTLDDRAVTRETSFRWQGRTVLVRLEQGGTRVSFRQKGRQKWYTTTVEAMFWMAVEATRQAEKAAKRREREARKAARAALS